MRFIANLRRETLDTFAEAGVTSGGYLLSTHRITPAALDDARRVRDLGLPLFADNGGTVLIESILNRFHDASAGIAAQVLKLRHERGRVPRGADVPPELRKQASMLAADVVTACTSASEAQDAEALVAAQGSMDPTDVIAREDFATACLLRLGLERETTGWPVERFVTRNERSLRLWRQVSDDPRMRNRRVHAVLSAMDYNTARAAGRAAARAGARHVAFGAASVTSDLEATDFLVIGTSTAALERPVPRRYVRLAQIVRGLNDGVREAGTRFERVHCLGLGSPALLPVPAIGFDAETIVTTDSTSPIHDAAKDRIFYDPLERGARSTTVSIVEHIVNGGEWPFVSPFTAAFRDRFGHDPERARRWWAEQGKPNVDMAMLQTPSVLTSALPLFAEADARIHRIAREARIAHNHWVLGAIAAQRTGPDRRAIALSILDGWLAGPPTVTTRGLTVAKTILLGRTRADG